MVHRIINAMINCPFVLKGMISVEEGENMPPVCSYYSGTDWYCNCSDPSHECPAKKELASLTEKGK